ncbi:hypothetical protein AGOR_G00180030 [Albula goreensis]|uniref:MAC-inhibitory protein n=1 Tax=Albula goreensis TaxID=1534307 RepID=A0A8T3CV86_9TELE|nr:hypothetical protein AGOR_G00180030 [Albula goreensis]
MSTSLKVGVLFCLAMFSLGSALKCYKCSGLSESDCTNVQQCSNEDRCLSATTKDGYTYRMCYFDSKCSPEVVAKELGTSSVKFKCCNRDLCNYSPATVVSRPLLGLLVLIAICWWQLF